jgi:hypothetical protein
VDVREVGVASLQVWPDTILFTHRGDTEGHSMWMFGKLGSLRSRYGPIPYCLLIGVIPRVTVCGCSGSWGRFAPGMAAIGLILVNVNRFMLQRFGIKILKSH